MNYAYRYDEQNGLDIVAGPTLELTVRRLGAEAIGLTWKHPRRGNIGLLWRNAQVADPSKFWKGHATILFPIVGGIHNLISTTTEGTRVQFKKQHGFVRHSVVPLIEKKEYDDRFELVYSLESNDETLAMYPWKFRLTITYALYRDQLTQSMTVENLDDGPMPYQLGWHPGINTPLVAGAKKDCHLQLPQGRFQQLHNDDLCYLTGEKSWIENEGDFKFTEHGLDRTYMFDLSMLRPLDRVVELCDPDNSVGVRLLFADYPHLGVWSDADAPFICIEPWQGMDDSVEQEAFDKKFGMTMLAPGETDTRQIEIEMIDNG